MSSLQNFVPSFYTGLRVGTHRIARHNPYLRGTSSVTSGEKEITSIFTIFHMMFLGFLFSTTETLVPLASKGSGVH